MKKEGFYSVSPDRIKVYILDKLIKNQLISFALGR